jgi:uncharacterized protein YrrD
MTRAFLLASLAAASAVAMPLLSHAEDVAAPPATMSNNLKVKFIDQEPGDRLASKLIGSDIHNKANDSIGSISDIVFDGHNTIKAFVVSVGGFLGVDAKYVAVDPSVVVVASDKNKMTVSIDTDKDQLRAAPEYRYAADQKKN